MNSKSADRIRGAQEATMQFEALRKEWPLAFPAKAHDVRPLAVGVITQIKETFGWSQNYARSVLFVWKGRTAYCRAILAYSERMNLDGSNSSEKVDENARALAQQQLLKNEARAAKKKLKEQATSATSTAA